MFHVTYGHYFTLKDVILDKMTTRNIPINSKYPLNAYISIVLNSKYPYNAYIIPKMHILALSRTRDIP